MNPYSKPGDRYCAPWWRATVDRAVSDFAAPVDVISPFGFELLGDPAFFRRDVVRLYVYVRVPADGPQDLADGFGTSLIDLLRRDEPAFFSTIRFFLAPATRTELHPQGTRSIRIGRVPSAGPMLDDYARYLVVCPHAIRTGVLREIVDFATSRSSRRYTFQLALILSRLFGAEHAPLGPEEVDRLRMLIRRLAPVTDADAHSPDRMTLSADEQPAFEQIVIPYAEALDAVLAGMPGATTLRAVDLHSGRELVTRVPPARVEAKLAAVKAAYDLGSGTGGASSG